MKKMTLFLDSGATTTSESLELCHNRLDDTEPEHPMNCDSDAYDHGCRYRLNGSAPFDNPMNCDSDAYDHGCRYRLNGSAPFDNPTTKC